MDDNGSVHQRIAEMIKALADGNQSAFGRAVGIATGTLAGFIGERQVKPGFEILQKIGRAYPQVRWEWLMFGEGEMLKPDLYISHQQPDGSASATIVEAKWEPPVISLEHADFVAAPVVNFKVAANYVAGYFSQEAVEHIEVMSFPRFMVKGVEHTVFPVIGDSMSTTFLEKDYVWCRLVPKTEWAFLRPNTVCVVVSKHNGLQLKRITVEAARAYIRCKSDNYKSNPPFDLDIDEVLALWEFQWRITDKADNANENLGDRVNGLEDRLYSVEEQLRGLLGSANLPIVK